MLDVVPRAHPGLVGRRRLTRRQHARSYAPAAQLPTPVLLLRKEDVWRERRSDAGTRPDKPQSGRAPPRPGRGSPSAAARGVPPLLRANDEGGPGVRSRRGSPTQPGGERRTRLRRRADRTNGPSPPMPAPAGPGLGLPPRREPPPLPHDRSHPTLAPLRRGAPLASPTRRAGSPAGPDGLRPLRGRARPHPSRDQPPSRPLAGRSTPRRTRRRDRCGPALRRAPRCPSAAPVRARRGGQPTAVSSPRAGTTKAPPERGLLDESRADRRSCRGDDHPAPRVLPFGERADAVDLVHGVVDDLPIGGVHRFEGLLYATGPHLFCD